jgi:hypothetical protein
VANEIPGQTFDLTALAAENDRLSAPTRRLVFGASLFLALAGTIGIGLLFRGARAGDGDSDSVQLAILVVGGFFLAVYGFTIFVGKGPAPRRLIVGTDALTLAGRPRGKAIILRWNDPRCRLTILDGRALPDVFASGRKRTVDFYIQPRFGPQSPIPAEAFEPILEQVRRHGLRLRGDPSPPDGPGSVKKLLILPARHP